MNLFNKPWVCKLLGSHKPDPKTLMYRERDPGWPCPEPNTLPRFDWDREHYYERHAKCIRCDEEISYARFFDFWGEKARFVDNNIREWLDEEDATSITPSADNPDYYNIISKR